MGLEAKLLAETNLRNLESQITNYVEKMKKMVGQLQEREEDNRKVSEKRRRGEQMGGIKVWIHTFSYICLLYIATC